MIMKRELTCIICPVGCTLSTEITEDKTIVVNGNKCPRGKAYAQAELTAPVRTVTSTVRSNDGKMIPVKTDRPIPKEKVKEAMKKINFVRQVLPISIGDVIIKDVFGSNVVATANVGGIYEECDSNCCRTK